MGQKGRIRSLSRIRCRLFRIRIWPGKKAPDLIESESKVLSWFITVSVWNSPLLKFFHYLHTSIGSESESASKESFKCADLFWIYLSSVTGSLRWQKCMPPDRSHLDIWYLLRTVLCLCSESGRNHRIRNHGCGACGWYTGTFYLCVFCSVLSGGVKIRHRTNVEISMSFFQRSCCISS